MAFHVSFVIPLYLSSFSPESVQRLGWRAFEDAVVGLDPAPRIDILTHQEDVFKSLISGLADGTILASPFNQGAVIIHLVHANIFFNDRLLSTEVFSMREEFQIDGQLVKLSPLERAEYLLQGDSESQDGYLCGILGRACEVEAAIT